VFLIQLSTSPVALKSVFLFTYYHKIGNMSIGNTGLLIISISHKSGRSA
jgi:hypothetical protein